MHPCAPRALTRRVRAAVAVCLGLEMPVTASPAQERAAVRATIGATMSPAESNWSAGGGISVNRTRGWIDLRGFRETVMAIAAGSGVAVDVTRRVAVEATYRYQRNRTELLDAQHANAVSVGAALAF